ncbi:MAG: DUF4159 domain-containing protein [Candidatus Latescibacteria bacterium]|nr:DUF4159 domain-containing protein [Candidatus Latescibacterota bacterium]
METKKYPSEIKRPSDLIDIAKLEKETQKYLYIGLVFALLLHPVIGSYFMFKKTNESVSRTYPMKLVLRSVRFLKPFELKPKHSSKRELQRTEMQIKQPIAEVKAKTDLTIEVTENLHELNLDTNIPESEKTHDEITGIDTTSVQNIPDIEKQISMKDEMISVEDMDTGQYRAMIVQNPDKINIRGFVYISTTWGDQLKVSDHLKRSIINLAEAVNRHTNIEAKIDSHLLLNSRRLLSTPFVIITTDKAFELSPLERENLGEYLKSGGFAVIDNGDPLQEYSQAESSLRQMLKDTLGNGIKFEPIPNDHQLYHCFFDFNEGPPQGAEISMVQTTTSGAQGETSRNASMSRPVHYLEGIWLDGRLTVVYSNKGYVLKWTEYDNNEPQLKMGVNMVVYALTHEGGIAQKTMSQYSSVQ